VTRKSVWVSDVSWAFYLLFIAVLFGVVQQWPLVRVAWQGELTAHLAKVRELRRQVRFQGVRTVNLVQAHALWEGGQALWVDARKPEEYAELHIQGALNLLPGTWQQVQDTPLATTPKDRPIVVYCSQAACDDALKTAEKLQAAGFTEVMAFLGGFRAWDEAGYPVDTVQ
jgi:rhodanese-related sulfurtransferase